MKNTARAIIINSKNQMLLVQHHKSNFWSLPGGKLGLGEDMKTALSREIFEELGVSCTLSSLEYVHEFRYSPESDVTTEFFFRVSLPSENLNDFKGEHTASELQKIEWVTIDEQTNIKPEFLKKYDCQSHQLEYFSLV